MLAGSMPVTAFAVTGEQVAADGTYTAEAAVVNDEAITEGDEWENYNVTVTVTVADGLIASIGTTDATEGSASYLAKAVSKKKGINTLLAGQPATAAAVEGWEAVSGATIASNAMKAAVLEALAGAPEAAAEPQKVCAYVLMNIPYDKFYEAEGVSGVEAVTSATVKTFNQNMAAGSYHDCYTTEDASNAEILGVTYPVYVEDVTLLEGFTEVTDDSAATITVAAGKSSLTTKGVTGRDVLFASPSYSYYVLADEPSAYKVMTASDGAVSFGAVQAAAVSGEADAELTYGGHYTDITLSVDAPEVTDTAKVNAVTMTMDDGSEYALRHVLHVWRKTELGWNYADWDLGGRTIKSLTYYLEDNGAFSVVTYPLDIAVKLAPKEVGASFAGNASMSVTGLPENIENPAATVKSKVGRGQTPVVLAENVPVTDGTIALDASPEIGTTYTVTVTSDNYADMKAEAEYNLYVLMNIPYEKFYENEISDGDHAVDAVSSATADMKTHNFSLFAGTYREESANAISGITYPVKVTAGVDLSAYTVVTDETTGTASWAVHGTANSHELSGSDCLFNCGDYAYYVLAEEPAAYKELTAGEDGTLSFAHVDFKYPGGEANALEDISFTAEPGKTTAIIGSTGSGKSTLVNLIPRLYDVTGGSITLDGVDIRERSLKDLRDEIGFVPQKAVLFSGTIASNLRFGKRDASKEELQWAAKIAQAEDFIEAKEEKYESEIAQGGSNVSGGQKQRLAIARALAKDAKVYVFDDSFSALDLKTDAALRRALEENMKDAVVIIVAQRISTVLHADQILVLDDGKIVGKGTHEELLRSCEVYEQIARSQMSAKELGLKEITETDNGEKNQEDNRRDNIGKEGGRDEQ